MTYQRIKLGNSLKIVVSIVTLIIVVLPLMQTFADTFTCSANVCSGSDAIGFGDTPRLFHNSIETIDSFIFSDGGIINSLSRLFANDLFRFTEHGGFNTIKMIVNDLFKITEFTNQLSVSSLVATITTIVTGTVTQLATGCGGSGNSCYTNINASGIELLMETIIFPVIFILGTVFGFIYMGIKYFGVTVLVASFILMGLAYIGIIPSYFTLLIIIAVGAALTKMITTMIGDTSGNTQ